MNKIITSKTNKQSQVYILKVFILDDKKTHHYPSFCIYEIEAFCFFSLEDCIVKMPHYIPDENLYCFVVEAHCCGVDMHFGTKERWLFLPDGTLFAHTFPGDEEIERNMEYNGRAQEDCHFKEGDMVEMIDDETVTLGIVLQQPPTPDQVEKIRKKLREAGMPEDTIDGSEDRYIILVDRLNKNDNSTYLHCSRGYLASELLPPSIPIPAKLKKRLQELLKRVKEEEAK